MDLSINQTSSQGDIMGGIGTLDKKDAIDLSILGGEVRRRIYNADASIKHKENLLGIFVKIADIRQQRSYDFINAKAIITNKNYSFNETVEVECRVAYGNWSKLAHLKEESINLMDHLQALFPMQTASAKIGLFTFQNGIQNTLKEFESMGSKIIGYLKQDKPLCIGFYNETQGKGISILKDLERLTAEWDLNARSILSIRQLIYTLKTRLPQNVLWTHIAHSEAGLICSEILTTDQYRLSLPHDCCKFIKNQLITLAYGAVSPIPNKTLHSINTYSREDITMWFARKYLDKYPKPGTHSDDALKKLAKELHENPHPFNIYRSKSEDEIFQELKQSADQFFIKEYPHTSTKEDRTVTIVKNLVPKDKLPLIEGDHAFEGQTYQDALSVNIDGLRKRYRIIDGF